MKIRLSLLAAVIIVVLLSLAQIKEAAVQEEIRIIETKEYITEYVFIPKVKRLTHTVTNNEPTKMLVTGYTAGPESTGKYPGDPSYGITATGTKVRMPSDNEPGTCAVDPNYIPLGTILYVDGYGLCRAEDTGGKVNGYHVDVYLESVDQVYQQIGKGKRNVWILSGFNE
ncbi:3D (Asp-Asp-Asp) domain-containing protein [Salirhabdus euzebyi]|uniref:3D (Asp-Asp-Asp) domain-containing protein n=1 Tax=Salirhabdus euzebyi TaxID=394506 RepID=A0A841PT77_9BACI|nr:3D domain-containing protein [Salirhabdus euzebyi]MBB6452000.1 3D (Asp-Asp-Asp) domain-containing protein [Salirhabdus euzebyi]